MSRLIATDDKQRLERLLRRHGIEGEAAFQLLAARYLAAAGKHHQQLSARFFAHTKRRWTTLRRDAGLAGQLDAMIASDPRGEGLADWYQHFVGRRFREGSGKFFTPRPVADAMASLLPRVARAVIMDPACGGGGFLLAASRRWREMKCHLIGNEIEPSLVALTEIALLLAAPAPHHWTLIESNLFDYGPPLRRWLGKVDYILANPPFSLRLPGAPVHKGLFALGYRTSDAVFLDVCFELLKLGGRLVCLLPHSLIVNAEYKRLRAAVEARWRLRGVITLPEGVFHLAARTTTRADILILDKPAPPAASPSDRTVFADAPTVGVPLNRRMKDRSNQLAEIVARTDVREALGLQEGDG
ncbi:MAG TPA: N-6 DNA methylase [Blastocatellia bacterium]|nr:N-6 DNA methylase [Blastocatellia bacterium]